MWDWRLQWPLRQLLESITAGEKQFSLAWHFVLYMYMYSSCYTVPQSLYAHGCLGSIWQWWSCNALKKHVAWRRASPIRCMVLHCFVRSDPCMEIPVFTQGSWPEILYNWCSMPPCCATIRVCTGPPCQVIVTTTCWTCLQKALRMECLACKICTVIACRCWTSKAGDCGANLWKLMCERMRERNAIAFIMWFLCAQICNTLYSCLQERKEFCLPPSSPQLSPTRRLQRRAFQAWAWQQGCGTFQHLERSSLYIALIYTCDVESLHGCLYRAAV